MSLALAGLAMGFLGSSHCLGMCGGIAAALPAASASRVRGGSVARSLAYNTGRIASYTAAGAVAGAFGSALAGLAGANAMLVLRSIAALLIIGVGLYVAGWSSAVVRIEALGAKLWPHLAPLARRMRGSTSPFAALAFGALWGWLPCGLVYSALAVAAASGSGVGGALVMAGFGLGTLPAMLAIALSAGGGAALLLRRRAARRVAGAMVVAFGVWTLVAVSAAFDRSFGGQAGCHEKTVAPALSRIPAA